MLVGEGQASITSTFAGSGPTLCSETI